MILTMIVGMQCGVSDTNLKLSLLMYCSYFVLFARYSKLNFDSFLSVTYVILIDVFYEKVLLQCIFEQE